MSVDVSKWYEVEPYGPQDEGAVGGDWQIGTAWGRRFARQLPSGRWAVVTDVYYTVADNQRAGREDDDETPNDIQNQANFVVCRDPDNIGETEEWGEYEYAWVDGDPTDEVAKSYCARLRPENYYGWRPEDKGF